MRKELDHTYSIKDQFTAYSTVKNKIKRKLTLLIFFVAAYCTLHMYLAYVPCICTLHVYLAYVPCICTLHMYLACVPCICITFCFYLHLIFREKYKTLFSKTQTYLNHFLLLLSYVLQPRSHDFLPTQQTIYILHLSKNYFLFSDVTGCI